MKKYIATYIHELQVVDEFEIEAKNKLVALEVARFHKETRGIRGEVFVTIKK